MTSRRPLLLILFSVLLTLATMTAPRRVAADQTVIPDWAIPGGYFFTQTNGFERNDELGYPVINDEEAEFWTWFMRLGGVQALGYPVSQRFRHGGFVAQAFQKGILLWDEQTQGVHLMNLFDELSAAGADPFLDTHRFIPMSHSWEEDAGEPWPVIVANHLMLLEEDPAIKAAFYAEQEQGRDPIMFNGLPMGIRDYGDVVVVRAQRRAFQHWKIETPWARAGEVVVVNGGDLAKELDLVPPEAQAPISAPVPPFGYGDLTQGAALYRDMGCVLCHGLQAEGGIGPQLAGTEFEFITFLIAVRTPSELMPPYLEDQVTDQEIRDILAYVLSLAAEP